MYKSTEISIPVKVDELFDLCPFPTAHLTCPHFGPAPSNFSPVVWVRGDSRRAETHKFHLPSQTPPRLQTAQCPSSITGLIRQPHLCIMPSYRGSAHWLL